MKKKKQQENITPFETSPSQFFPPSPRHDASVPGKKITANEWVCGTKNAFDYKMETYYNSTSCL